MSRSVITKGCKTTTSGTVLTGVSNLPLSMSIVVLHIFYVFLMISYGGDTVHYGSLEFMPQTWLWLLVSFFCSFLAQKMKNDSNRKNFLVTLFRVFTHLVTTLILILNVFITAFLSTFKYSI
ncbi:hypothetical protein BS333_21085 (plasmid) [Vibrio azureus]|uniref:hypothetical protein n=1 Tax=Vibrio azureus TaxID=512649 RepID=UPI000519417A|nr:hypothetical protein [Vibrio azureus]AUI88871.1 hypothetical protein BS333_21085 [Vibrio azureus]